MMKTQECVTQHNLIVGVDYMTDNYNVYKIEWAKSEWDWLYMFN